MGRRNRASMRAGVGLLLLVLVLAACGDDGDGGGAASGEPTAGASGASGSPGAGGVGCAEAKGKVVGFSQPLPDPNFAAIEKILVKALSDHGAQLRSTNANLDPGKQIADITTLLQQQVDVLIANPVDPNAVRAVFDQVRRADVPIVALDTLVGGPYFTTVREDMQSAGAQGAKLLKEAVGNGKVAAMYGPPFAEILNWEKEGFDTQAAKSGLAVVDRAVNERITPQGAKGIADAWKEKHGAELKGIWTFNDVSAIGVASSLTPRFSPVIVSINGQPDVIPLIKDGKVLATFAVPYQKTGQALAYAALAAICGRAVPKEIIIPVSKLDKSNVESYRPISARVNDPFEIELEDRDGKSYVKVD